MWCEIEKTKEEREMWCEIEKTKEGREIKRERTNGIDATSCGDARGNVCPRALVLGLFLDPDQFGVGKSSGLGADEVKGEGTDLLDAREGDVL